MADTHGEPCWACTPRAPRFVLHTNSASPLWKALQENALWQPGRPSSPGVWGGVLLLTLTPPHSARPRLGCKPWGFCHPSGAHFTGEDGEAEARVRVGDGEPRPFSRSLGSCDPGSEHRGHRSLPAASCRPGREHTEPGAGCSQSISARKSPRPAPRPRSSTPHALTSGGRLTAVSPRPDSALGRKANAGRQGSAAVCRARQSTGPPAEAPRESGGGRPAGGRVGGGDAVGTGPLPTHLAVPSSLSLSVTTCR